VIKETVTLDETIEYLNELIKLDRDAIQQLATHRAFCNSQLAGHPTCQVNEKVLNVDPDPHAYPYYEVGLIGILNGLFGVNELGNGNLLFMFDDSNNLVKVAKRE
jgi:hypothetical protein